MSDSHHDRVPNWYREIFPAGPSDGFYHKMGYHAASFVDRGSDRLIVSFDNLSDAGNPYLDVQPWAAKFVQDNGWSHLGIYARGPSWYRDRQINDFFDGLRDRNFFAGFKSVTFTGTSMGGFAALAYSDHAPGAIVMALSPQTTLDLAKVPWENRFKKAQRFDWSLPYSDAAATISKARLIYTLYDPFLQNDLAQVQRLKSDHVIHLKAFGCGHKTAVVLRRMEMLKPIMARALTGELTEAEFYRMIRPRRNLVIYRKVMETHLTSRGKEARIPQLQQAFRLRRRQTESAAAATVSADPKTASDPEPALQNPTKMQPRPVAQPRSHAANVNIWMAEDRDGAFRYMSDRYAGRVMGFEERNGITLAQTADLVIGHVAYGGVAKVDRPVPEDFRYHVITHALDGTGRPTGARAMGIATIRLKDANAEALCTILATDVIKAGVTAPEAAQDGPLFAAVAADLTAAVDALAEWGKSLFVDRVALRLLSGAPDTAEDQATRDYVHVARALQRDIPRVTGQKSFPKIVISQTFGSRTDGRSPVALAEGRLDQDNPATGFIVATPTYPFALMEDMPATLDPAAQILVDELEARAVAEVQQGRQWHCPLLRYALIRGALITAEFTAMSGLVLDGADHGFRVHDGAQIIIPRLVRLDGTTAILACDQPLMSQDPWLTYAWGMTQTDGSTPANAGGVRDQWSAPSVLCPNAVLHRYALSARVRIIEASAHE